MYLTSIRSTGDTFLSFLLSFNDVVEACTPFAGEVPASATAVNFLRSFSNLKNISVAKSLHRE